MEYGSICPYCLSDSLENEICTFCGKQVGDMNRPLSPGTLLEGGHYRIERALGSGGFGITYRAWNLQTNQPVAVKELFPANCAVRRAGNPMLLVPEDKQGYFRYSMERFLQEATVIYKLRDYSEILRIYSRFRQYGTAYYAMQYLDGENMDRFLRREKSISWQQLSQPVWDVLRTLQIIHQNNLIHRDISPDNIIRLRNGQGVLIDFGSTRDYATNNRFTTIIKRSFAPPEMLLTYGKQGPWTDVYLLSGTLYYLLSGGKVPKRTDDRVASLYTTGQDSLVPLSSFSPNAPEHVTAAIEQGLSSDIEDRFQSAEEMLQALYGIQRPMRELLLSCSRGIFQGRLFSLPREQVVTIGTGRGNSISYPEGTRGISHRQCAFYADKTDLLYVQDLSSRFGTFLDQQRIPSGVWIPMNQRQSIRLGDTADIYEVIMAGGAAFGGVMQVGSPQTALSHSGAGA